MDREYEERQKMLAQFEREYQEKQKVKTKPSIPKKRNMELD